MEISIYILLALLWAALSLLAVSYFFYRKLGKSYDIESANGKNLRLLLEREKQLKEKLQLELVESKESANREISVLTTKYAHIIDIDSAVEDARKIKDEIEFASIQLNNNYRDKKIIFDQLVAQAAIYDEEVMLAELGFYKPHFDFDTSEKYKEAIELNNLQQKDLISKNKAVYCAVQWTVEGSKTKGDAFSKRIVKLTARAFNNECDASIANVRWNNVQRIEQRITKAFETINKLNESSNIFISPEYLNLKLSELRLTYEHADKKQQEKEEQAEIKRQIREEAILKEEQEKALADEAKYQALLEKAKQEAEQSSGEKLERLHAVILELNSELQEAHTKSQRAMSMAQQTKAGHVYIISNIGSFGENTFKIGMTRRLEPLDRVRELGDASVPFTFDVHAMIYTEDAPTLENELHKIFAEKRINLVNYRKEFFNVTLDEIQKAVETKAPEAEFYITAEAREHRESLAIRAQREHKKMIGDPRAAFPDAISEVTA